jgi:hypothetical protein
MNYYKPPSMGSKKMSHHGCEGSRNADADPWTDMAKQYNETITGLKTVNKQLIIERDAARASCTEQRIRIRNLEQCIKLIKATAGREM